MAWSARPRPGRTGPSPPCCRPAMFGSPCGVRCVVIGRKWPSMVSWRNSHRNITKCCGEHRNITEFLARLMEVEELKQTCLRDCGEAPMKIDDLRQRKTPLELSSQEFRTLGYRLVDRIAGHFETLAN